MSRASFRKHFGHLGFSSAASDSSDLPGGNSFTSSQDPDPEPTSSLTKHYQAHTLQLDDLPQSFSPPPPPSDSDDVWTSWKTLLRKSFLCRKSNPDDSNSIYTPRSSSASRADPASSSYAAAAAPPPSGEDSPSTPGLYDHFHHAHHYNNEGNPQYQHGHDYGHGHQHDDFHQQYPTPAQGYTTPSNLSARSPSPLFLPRHNNHSLTNTANTNTNTNTNTHTNANRDSFVSVSGQSDHATATGLFRSTVTASDDIDDGLLNVAAAALADVFRGGGDMHASLSQQLDDATYGLSSSAAADPDAPPRVDVADLEDVWDNFIRTMSDCATLTRPDHRTVLIALLRATVHELGISTLIPWHTDSGASPFSAPTPPAQQQQQRYASSSSSYMWTPPQTNNLALHTIAEGRRRFSDHVVTSVLLLGFGEAAEDEGKESRLKRIKRAKARFLKRAFLLASRSHIPGNDCKYSDVIDMQVMLSFALSVVVVVAALAKCGCEISLQTPLILNSPAFASVSYVPKGGAPRRTSMCPRAQQRAQEQQQDERKRHLTSTSFNVRATYYGARIAFAVSFREDAPCQVTFRHPGILAVRHANRFAELVGEVRALAEAFERKVLVWECARRAVAVPAENEGGAQQQQG